MGALTWICAISFCIAAECHLQILKHPRFHLIPKFPEDFFSYDDSFYQDSKPIAPVTLVDQHDGDIKEKEIEDDSDILAKKLPEEKHEEDIIKEKRLDQEQQIQPEPMMIIPGKPEDAILSVHQIQPEPMKIISGKPEDAILSVQQQEPINKDIAADPKLENAKVKTELTTEKPSADSDADIEKDDQKLSKNTDYVLIPVAAINTDQFNTNGANPSVANQAVSYPLQATNSNVQPNQFGTTIPQNYIPVNNGVNSNGEQPIYTVNVPNNVTPQENDPANTIYYLNNPSNNNMGYQGAVGTPYNLVPLGYQQNNQPNNYVVPINQPNNLVASSQPIRASPLNNPNGYYAMPNNAYNQQNYPTGYVYQPNNPNSYTIQPNNGNNLNYQRNNPGQQNYPSIYYVQPNNLNNQNGYNNPNNLKYQHDNPNGYVNQPDNFNYQQNNPNGYVNQPNNLNYQQKNPNGYVNQPNNLNYQQNNPNGYLNQPNNLNNYPNNPNGYNNQPNNPNAYGNQPNSFNNYPNNLNNYNNQPNNQYSNVNPANNLSDPNGNINGPNDQQNSYANQPNNYNYQPNNPNGYNAQPQYLNNQQNYPNGYNNQPNNFDSYKDKQNNSALVNNSSNAGTSGNVLVDLNTSLISDNRDNNILVPLLVFKDNKDSVDIEKDVQKDEESKE